MTKESCPDEWTFNAMLRHQLDDSERRRFERHLDGCPECFGALAILAGSSAAAHRVAFPSDTLSQPHPNAGNERQRLLAATVIGCVIHGICIALLWPVAGVGSSSSAALLGPTSRVIVEATVAVTWGAGGLGLLALAAGIRGWPLQRKFVQGYAVAMMVTPILVPLAGALLGFSRRRTVDESSRNFEPQRKPSQGSPSKHEIA